MEQPILFQTRVIDFPEIAHLMDETILNIVKGHEHLKGAELLYWYLTSVDADEKARLMQGMQRELGIDLSKLTYKRLDRPLAYDAHKEVLKEASCIDYTSTGILHAVAVFVDDTRLKFWTHFETDYYVPKNSYVTDIKLLKDGWV